MSDQPRQFSRYGTQTLSSGDCASRRLSNSTLFQSSISPIYSSAAVPYSASSAGPAAAVGNCQLHLNPTNLAGIEIEPFRYENGVIVGGQQPIQSAGDATPHAGRLGKRHDDETVEAAMTLRQSMAVLGGDQPGRLGSTFTQALGNGNGTMPDAFGNMVSGAVAQGTPLQRAPNANVGFQIERDGEGLVPIASNRYGVISPQSDGSSMSASASVSPATRLGSDAPHSNEIDVGGTEATQLSYDVEPFLLPSMPTNVKCLVFSLLSNWGDTYYVGLSGIEVFDAKGKRIVPPSPSSSASASASLSSSSKALEFSIHSTFDVISRLGNKFGGLDLRASCIAGASNLSNAAQLVNGNYKKSTTDANEMFRMPVNFGSAFGLGDLSENGGVGIGGFNPSSSPTASNNNALIWINFSEPVSISLIRIYNYNMGREHTFKGVQLMEILSASASNEELLFRGEIAMASGDRFNEPEQILFASPSPSSSAESTDLFSSILNKIIEEDSLAAEQLKEKDPMMKVVSPTAVLCHGNSGGSAGPSSSLTENDSSTAVKGSARCASPAPLSASGGLAPPIVTSFTQKKALLMDQQQQQRAGSPSPNSASNSRGGSSGGTASTLVRPISGVQPAISLRNGRVTSASSSALRPASSHHHTNPRSHEGAPHSNTKAVSFALEGLSDGTMGKGRHPAAADPASCPRNVTGVCIGIQSTWGDPHFVGLSGIRFFTSEGELCFNVAQLSVARPPHTSTGISQAEAAALSAFDGEVSALTDGDVTTACSWRFQEQMQIRVRFDPPVPSLGFIEIANYGISGSTQCGVKVAQLFVSTSHTNTNALFEQLWFSSSPPDGVKMLTTPECPLIIRKSPSQLNILKHQSFDLSSVSVGLDAPSYGGGGGIRGAVTLTTSMTASMAARAKTEMKRARMALFDGPPASNAVPHGMAVATSILPQGYVIKLELKISATAETAAGLKPLLKTLIQEGLGSKPSLSSSGTAAGSAAITLYDEDCMPISKDLYNAAVTLKHESTSLVANYYNSGVYSPSTFSGGGILDGGRGGGGGGMKGDVTASIVIDRAFREAIKVQQNVMQPAEERADTQERHTVSTTFSFVFDIPTAISAVSHHFRALQSAQGRILKHSSSPMGPSSASLTSVRVLVDDEIAYESLEFDMDSAAAAMLSGDADDLVDSVEPPPRSVAFVWDPKLLPRFL